MIIKMYTPKYGERELLIDDEDYVIFAEYTWTLWSSKRHNSIYVVTTRSKRNGLKYLRLHRQIMKAGPKDIVDHINGNALDNRKCNLRITDSSGNNKNAAKRRNAQTSKFKGVSFYKQTNKWKAQIQVNKRKISLGYHKTELEAATAYNKAALLYFKDFAIINKVEESK